MFCVTSVPNFETLSPFKAREEFKWRYLDTTALEPKRRRNVVYRRAGDDIFIRLIYVAYHAEERMTAGVLMTPADRRAKAFRIVLDLERGMYLAGVFGTIPDEIEPLQPMCKKAKLMRSAARKFQNRNL